MGVAVRERKESKLILGFWKVAGFWYYKWQKIQKKQPVWGECPICGCQVYKEIPCTRDVHIAGSW